MTRQQRTSPFHEHAQEVLPKTQIESLLKDTVIRQHQLWKNMKMEYQ